MNTWTNNNNTTYEIKPVPPWLAQVVANKAPKIQPPTYQVPIIGGGFQDEPYTKKTITEIGSDEDKAAFARYEAEQEKINQRVLDEVIDKTIEMGLVDATPSDDFTQQVRIFDPDIDEAGLKKMYLFGEVAPTIEEKLGLYIAIAEISQNHESMEVALEGVKAMFRQFNHEKRNAIKQIAEGQAGQLARADSGDGVAGDEGMGNKN